MDTQLLVFLTLINSLVITTTKWFPVSIQGQKRIIAFTQKMKRPLQQHLLRDDAKILDEKRMCILSTTLRLELSRSRGIISEKNFSYGVNRKFDHHHHP